MDLKISPDEHLLAISKSSRVVEVYEVPSLRLLYSFKMGDGSPDLLAFSSDSRYVFCACVSPFDMLSDGPHDLRPHVEIWKIAEGKCVSSLPIQVLGDWITGMALSPDGKTLILATDRHRCSVFSLSFSGEKAPKIN
jgi:WD40 repeat protein